MNENMMNDDSQMETAQPEKKSNLLAILGIVAVVAIAAFVMIQANTSNPAPAGVTPSPTPVVTVTPTVSPTPTEEVVGPVEEVVEVEMEAADYTFSPSEITVKLGQTVRITLTANDMQHNFSLDDFDVESEVVAEGESTTIEFLADQVGEFEYYCNVGTHRSLGQVGTLIVEE